MKRLAVFLLLIIVPVTHAAGPPVDHHQHLLAKEMTEQGQKPIDGKSMIAMLDAAGIRRAVLLSNAYRYGNPGALTTNDEYARVMAENDWTAREAAKYPKRLVAFCGFNPLKDYALSELNRCARDKRFGRGIKLQFGSSDVDLNDPTDIALLRRVFRAANANKLAIVVHLRTRRAAPFGAAQATTFIDEVIAEAPDVVVQIAHFAGGGSPNDPPADEALGVFAAAIARAEPRVRNVYFDTALIAPADVTPARAAFVAQKIRQIGTKRILYGSDGGDPTDPPAKQMLAAFRKLPLTAAEFKAIESNVAPYLK
jgi:predicted TIM-barrel fold metal-dependent hydrolase